MKNSRTKQRTTEAGARRAPASRRRPAARHARPRAGTTSRLARTLVDHDEIRRWAEERGAQPTAVKGTSRRKDDVGMIRLDFPGYSGAGKLAPIDWDEWFEKFDASNLALVVQEKTAGGEVSNFNKLVAREGAGTRRARQSTGARSGARSDASTGSRSGTRSGARSGSRPGARSGSRAGARSRTR